MKGIDELLPMLREKEEEIESSGLRQRFPERVKRIMQQGRPEPPRGNVDLFFGKKNIIVKLHHMPQEPDRNFFHCHGFFEMIYVYRGQCINRWWGQDDDLVLNEQDVLLLNPLTPHAPYTLTNEDCIFDILFKRDLFEHSMLSLISDNHLFSSFISDCMYQMDKAQEYLYFPSDEEFSVLPIMQMLIPEYYHNQSCQQRVLESLLVVLFANLARNYHKHHQAVIGVTGTGTVADMISYINDHVASVSLDELADQFGYTPSYVSRMIRRNTGKTYSEIVQKFKLEKARFYLEDPSRSISEISQLIGCDTGYFHKIFKQRYGITPSQYQKSFQIEPEAVEPMRQPPSLSKST